MFLLRVNVYNEYGIHTLIQIYAHITYNLTRNKSNKTSLHRMQYGCNVTVNARFRFNRKRLTHKKREFDKVQI